MISCETGRREVVKEERGEGGRERGGEGGREGGYVVNAPLSNAPGARDINIRHADMEGCPFMEK